MIGNGNDLVKLCMLMRSMNVEFYQDKSEIYLQSNESKWIMCR